MNPDPHAPVWSTLDVAKYLGVHRNTVTSWVARGQMPAPDHRGGVRIMLWYPRTIIAWHNNRPRKQGRSS